MQRPLNPVAQNSHFLAKIDGGKKADYLPIVLMVWAAMPPKSAVHESGQHLI
jgi:hypothetical protein